MKNLSTYIKESYDNFLKLSEADKSKLLKLDLEYGELMLIARYETVCRRINNIDKEWEKFEEKHINNGENYYPTVEHKDLNYEKYDLENRVNNLIEKFADLNCILSSYYITNLESVLNQINYLKTLNDADYEMTPYKKYAFDDNLIDDALDIIHNTDSCKLPDDPMYERTMTGKEVKKIIQDNLKELGFDWKIIIDNNMPPRMGVNPEKTFRIRETAKFSDVDVESLIAHEIKGHVQKRYNAYQTGLFLFVFGLPGKNVFDEGMAIWNTFNLTEHHKPAALFNIAFSYIVCYYCSKYDFCTAFDKLKDLVVGKDVSDKRIFTQMFRSKRSTIRTDRLGYWSGDIDYFRGFKLIDEMTTKEREKILRWNVGPNQYYMINTFDKFIKTNNIKPITNEKLDKIKKNYPDLKE